jgi:hypothetical protein
LNLIPIVATLKSKRVRATEDVIGVISPVHGMTLPVPASRFIRKLDLPNSEYIFAVVTRGGTVTRDFRKTERLLKHKNRKLGSCFIIDMPSNDPEFRTCDVPSPDDMTRIETQAQVTLERVREIVDDRRFWREEDLTAETCPYSRIGNYLMERLVLPGMAFAGMAGANDYFHCDEKCSGCGICERVCWSG